MPKMLWPEATPNVVTGFWRFTNYPLWVAQQRDARERDLEVAWETANPIVSPSRLDRDQ